MPEEDKKLEYLKRDEVKTMQKDIAGIREVEAKQEREKISQIKTAEEVQRERERIEMAQKASEARKLAEEATIKREEEMKRIREAALKEGEPRPEESGRESARAEGFKEAMRETQAREEEERKKFLERVMAKAEGLPASRQGEVKLPPPPPLSPIPKPSKRPSSARKILARMALIILVLATIAALIGFWYWYLKVREKPAPSQITETKEELIIPTALINTEASRTLEISSLGQILKEDLGDKQFTRLIIKDPGKNQVLGLKELFDSFKITPPDDFYGKLARDATFFVYSQEEGNRLGFVAKVSEQEDLADMMMSWEGTMEDDFQGLFELLGKDEPALVPYFKDAKYQGTSFRFQTFSRRDLGTVYAVFDDYFIMTTSWKSMEKTLDKLKSAPLSFFSSPDNGAEFVLAEMSLKGKIGQFFFIGINGTTLTPATEQLIASVQPGGILLLKRNIINEDQTKRLIRDLQQIALKNYGIPLFIGIDQEGGAISPASFIQEKTAQSAIKTADQAYAVGFSKGKALKNLGINLNLAPVLDVAQPGDFIFGRTFQTTDPELNAIVKALISGQKTASILTAIKHFPGYGDIVFDPERKLATLDETPETSLFKAAAQAQPEFIMTSNVIYAEIDPELPFSFSQEGLKLLKQNVGSEPLIMTDDLPQQALINKFSLKELVTLPVKAGADILTFSTNSGMMLSEAVHVLNEAVQNKEISQAQIDDSVLKIIKLKKAYYSNE